MRQAVWRPYLSYLYLWKSFCPRSQADQIPAASISFHSQFRFYPPSLLYQKPGWLCYFEVLRLSCTYIEPLLEVLLILSSFQNWKENCQYCSNVISIHFYAIHQTCMLNRYFALFHIFPKPVARLAGGKWTFWQDMAGQMGFGHDSIIHDTNHLHHFSSSWFASTISFCEVFCALAEFFCILICGFDLNCLSRRDKETKLMFMWKLR